jgi:hypothetical protein
MFSKTLFINLILIFLILLGTWYTWLQLTRPVNSAITGNQPDAYATKVIVYHIDKSGNLYDQLTTPLSIHYPLATLGCNATTQASRLAWGLWQPTTSWMRS